MKQGQRNSYASKASKTVERKTVTIQEPVKNQDVGFTGDVPVTPNISPIEPVAGEKLLLSDTSSAEGVTCDEFTHMQPQPTYVDPGAHPGHQMTPGGPVPMMMPSPGGPMMMPSPGPGPYNMVPPPHVYSQGSPPLPLAAPLHLVYLQPTPHGVNIIPFQAAGFPTFSPASPLGFPAHPHHPVVVQSPQHFPTPQSVPVGPGKSRYPFICIMPIVYQLICSEGFPPVYDPNGVAYLPNNVPAYDYPSNEGAWVPPHDLPHQDQTPIYRSSKKLFRPWEDKADEDKTPKMSKVAFVEEDFPSLQTGLTKMNIK